MTKAEGDHLGTGNHPGTTPSPTVAATPSGATSGLFRKRPVVIEAYQFHNRIGTDTRPAWIVAAANAGVVKFHQPRNAPGYLTIDTLEGQMRADVDDWIIKGVKGEIYPCKSDIFAATYEPADADQREVTATGVRQGPGMRKETVDE